MDGGFVEGVRDDITADMNDPFPLPFPRKGQGSANHAYDSPAGIPFPSGEG